MIFGFNVYLPSVLGAELVGILAGNGANVNVVDNKGKTALHYAAQNSKILFL